MYFHPRRTHVRTGVQILYGSFRFKGVCVQVFPRLVRLIRLEGGENVNEPCTVLRVMIVFFPANLRSKTYEPTNRPNHVSLPEIRPYKRRWFVQWFLARSPCTTRTRVYSATARLHGENNAGRNNTKGRPTMAERRFEIFSRGMRTCVVTIRLPSACPPDHSPYGDHWHRTNFFVKFDLTRKPQRSEKCPVTIWLFLKKKSFWKYYHRRVLGIGTALW